MHFLIFDSNRVYAKKVGVLIQEHVQGAKVEFAHDVPVLQERLKKHYNIILADVDTTWDTELAIEILSRVKNGVVILWSAVRGGGSVEETLIMQRCGTAKVLQKAFDLESVAYTLDSVMALDT